MENWAERAIFYHIYPLGFCGAPMENNESLEVKHTLIKVIDWIPHFKELGINAIYFGPLFQSVAHGYDTIDYTTIDRRLGTNEDFKLICDKLHEAGIKVVIDGVFNHVGRDFFAFKDLKEKREASPYKDWFINVNFGGNSPYQDGFSYEGWEGYYNLVKLNVNHPDVKNYIFNTIRGWVENFDIDGLRLDVAYCIDENFLRDLRNFADALSQEKQKFIWLMGEIIHGDYTRLLKPGMLYSVTDYECYKGIYSSHNDKNYFEINYSMNRLFAKGGLYCGSHLYNFVDNHDVNRIASTLKEIRCIYNVYTLLFTMPGIPSIYYGGEWQIKGIKENGSDAGLRPCIELDDMKDKDDSLIKHIKKLSDIKKKYDILNYGDFEQVVVKNEQLIFARNLNGQKVYTALNLTDKEQDMSFNVNDGAGEYINLLEDNKKLPVENGQCKVHLKPFESMVIARAE